MSYICTTKQIIILKTKYMTTQINLSAKQKDVMNTLEVHSEVRLYSSYGTTVSSLVRKGLIKIITKLGDDYLVAKA